MDNTRVIDEQVAQAAPESQDEACCYALKHQAQPDADHCCMAYSKSMDVCMPAKMLETSTESNVSSVEIKEGSFAHKS